MNFRDKALETLKERRPFPAGSPDWNYRTKAAWTYLQIHMKRAAVDWKDTPPPVTVRER